MFCELCLSFVLNLLQYTVLDRWAGGSLTRRPKGPFAVTWPKQLGEQNVTIIIRKLKYYHVSLLE